MSTLFFDIDDCFLDVFAWCVTFGLSHITYHDIIKFICVWCAVKFTAPKGILWYLHGTRTRVRFISGLFSRMRGLMLRIICERRLPLEARVYVWFIRYVVNDIGNLIIASNKERSRIVRRCSWRSVTSWNVFTISIRGRLQ